MENNGTFDNSQGTFVNEGFLRGTGVFQALREDRGALKPGNLDAGVMSITGDLKQIETYIRIELGTCSTGAAINR